MIKKLLFIACLLLTAGHLFAQARFFSAIKVEFEKTTSVRAQMKELDDDGSWFEQSKEHFPVTTLDYYDFTGDSSKSLYKPGKEVPPDPKMWWRPVADKNVVYTDFQKGITIAQKPVFEETFLMEDSLLKIKWKITNDIRTIAGFECRKAVGLVNDSITVFAFYADVLMVNGGPEGIHGLPGMILGMGIPRLHATWFATKVEVFDINMSKVVPATKGKKVTRTTISSSLEKVMKEWGNYGSKLIVNFLI
jgi:GLPGLI family protein